MALGKIFDAFMADCAAVPDPSGCGKMLSDGVVFTIHGDTPEGPHQPQRLARRHAEQLNWLYVYGNGSSKTGWHGGVMANRTVNGFDPATGNTVAGQGSGTTAQAAAAAAAYAVAKGDMRRVQDFYRGGSIAGIINPITI